MSETNGEEKGPRMRWGLVMLQGRFLWRLDAWYWWIPFQHAILALWNNYACWRWGHDDILWHLAHSKHIPFDEADCINCCKRLTECVGGHELPYQSKEGDDGPQIN